MFAVMFLIPIDEYGWSNSTPSVLDLKTLLIHHGYSQLLLATKQKVN
jgi:hypothetical protein